MKRPLAALASIVLAVLGFVFLLPPDCASACSCGGGGGSQKEIVERALSNSSAVFSGEVIDVQKGGLPYSRVTLRVSEVWKGPQRETMEVGTPTHEVSCGYPFKEGQEYLVYAYIGKQGSPPRPGLKTDLCTVTTPLSKASADLALLGNSSEKPKDGSKEILSDTSGGVSVRAMVGIAGLVMAASLLVVVRLVRTG
jgi:hypothetical protein